MASIGQELLNVPMGDMIRQMAFAIAEGQYQLDENSINVAEMMGGLTTVYDEEGNVSFDDSRVFFGYEYMTMKEARAFAAVDDALTGTMGADVIKLNEILDKIDKDVEGNPVTDDSEIRVPTRLSMLELGFAPVFYQFVDTIIEVKIAIKITRTREYSRTRSNMQTERTGSHRRKRSFWGTSRSSSNRTQVSTSQVDATYASKYSYTAEGASLLRTKLSPVPPPPMLEERIRGLMDNEEARRQASLEKKRTELGLDTPS
ncbi:hypothetical protein [Candidatus Endoriftia persephone]|nr:hypothetical protein [Candidatus Endoriftia persephone]EGV50217.1 hypothetical protein Rifp1Sym_ds00020 [endosymbiont of Riftia pachyptila (vent Ph05)]USF88258.1 hypothetical protein L0Y14_03195 [Candidatus Endoriftia persephone]